MKATGIVRRIDDLGRIVVPKEIRTTLRLREGDQMEIYRVRDGAVVLEKYSPLHDMSKLAHSYVKILFELLEQPIVLCDKDRILAVEGLSKGIYEGAIISAYLEGVLSKGQIVEQINEAPLELKINEKIDTQGYAIVPININGDILGAFILLLQQPVSLQSKLPILQAFVTLLGMQLG